MKKIRRELLKRPISAEDKELFRSTVRDTKSLKQEKRITPHIQSKPSHAARRTAAEYHPSTSTVGISSHTIAPTDWLDAQDTLHFARAGLQRRLIQRLRRGQVPIGAHIDLHRKTIEEAVSMVTQFIEACISQSIRWICIIHGKGHLSSEGKPILKTFLNQWLRAQPEVLAFHSAKPKDGGTGAVYVLLRTYGK